MWVRKPTNLNFCGEYRRDGRACLGLVHFFSISFFLRRANRNTTMSSTMLDHTLLTIKHAGISNIYNISKWGIDDYELGSFLSQEINLREPKVQNVLVRTTTTTKIIRLRAR
jgi:hypothetical protein